jgi:hypothetical protein
MTRWYVLLHFFHFGSFKLAGWIITSASISNASPGFSFAKFSSASATVAIHVGSVGDSNAVDDCTCYGCFHLPVISPTMP